ncbi:DivIVA domain-containing protein [Bifidobacterium longum]|uniref:DivIVA domain-containing protein n=1 Tax=Bifidobacterium longum TaxID=216816 RepID=UPI0030F4B115
MAQELREGDGKSGIARAGKRKWGYDPAQVDAFLERAHALYDSEGMNLTQHDIQNVSFDLRKNGYVIAQVDAALGRLERAVVDKQTTWEIAQHGRVTWKAKTEKLYHEVQNHAERNERERFKSGAPKQPSYDKKQVDRLVDQIVDKAAAALGVDGVTEDDVRSLDDLNADTVNNVSFTQRKGKRGYDERQVDYFLNACVQLLSRLESYARVADFVSGEPAAPAQTATNVTVQANGVSPLFASGTQRPATDERFAPSAAAHDESFDALHQAEQSLFTAPAPVAPAAPAAAAPIAYAPAPASFDASTSTNSTNSTNAEQPVSFAPAAYPVHASNESAAKPVSETPSVAPTAAVAAEPPVSAPSAPVSGATAGSAPSFAPAQSSHESAAPSSTPSVFAEQPVDMVQNDSSLAALAHMAAVSQELPAVDVPSFAPKMPSLDTPNALKLNEVPGSVSSPAPSAPAAQPVNSTADEAASAAMSVSFAPTSKPDRNTNSIPVRIFDSQPADSTTSRPAAESSEYVAASHDTEAAQPSQDKHDSNDSFPLLFPLVGNFDSDIPDLSFPTLNNDDTKKEQ